MYQHRIVGEHTLEEFALEAVEILKRNSRVGEVVHEADMIIELKTDHRTPAETIYALPTGFVYQFSGFWGMYIGVQREVTE